MYSEILYYVLFVIGRHTPTRKFITKLDHSFAKIATKNITKRSRTVFTCTAYTRIILLQNCPYRSVVLLNTILALFIKSYKHVTLEIFEQTRTKWNCINDFYNDGLHTFQRTNNVNGSVRYIMFEQFTHIHGKNFDLSTIQVWT